MAAGNRFEARLHVLDAIRGFCALVVLLFHSSFVTDIAVVQSGYLAVDLFFMMSGVVLSRAYDAKLRSGLGTLGFMRRRYVRLMPIWLVGVAIGASVMLGLQRSVSIQEIGALLAACVFVPVPLATSPYLFAFNLPGWSLFVELLVNLLFAAAHRLLRGSGLIVVIVLAGLWLSVVSVTGHGINNGAEWRDAIGAIPRVLFAFFVGVLLNRRIDGRACMHLGWPSFAVGAIALTSVFCFRPTTLAWLYDLAVVCLLFPLLIAISAQASVSRGMGRVASALGELSYPLYATHFPMLFAGRAVYGHVTGWTRTMSPTIIAAVAVAALLLAALLSCYSARLSRVFDKLLPRRQRVMAAVTA